MNNVQSKTLLNLEWERVWGFQASLKWELCYKQHNLLSTEYKVSHLVKVWFNWLKIWIFKLTNIFNLLRLKIKAWVLVVSWLYILLLFWQVFNGDDTTIPSYMRGTKLITKLYLTNDKNNIVFLLCYPAAKRDIIKALPKVVIYF